MIITSCKVFINILFRNYNNNNIAVTLTPFWIAQVTSFQQPYVLSRDKILFCITFTFIFYVHSEKPGTKQLALSHLSTTLAIGLSQRPLKPPTRRGFLNVKENKTKTV